MKNRNLIKNKEKIIQSSITIKIMASVEGFSREHAEKRPTLTEKQAETPKFNEKKGRETLKVRSKKVDQSLQTTFAKLPNFQKLAEAAGDEARTLYKEAENRLKNVKENLEKITNQLNSKIDPYLAQLQTNDLFKNLQNDDPALIELFTTEPNPQKILDLVNLINPGSLNESGPSLNEIKTIFVLAKKLGRTVEDFAMAYNFQKKYKFPIKENALVAVRSPQASVKISPGILIAAKYCHDDPAKIAILRSVFENTPMLTGENVRIFLEDPAIEFCEEVHRKTNMNADLALKIGRTIYLSGIELGELKNASQKDVLQIADRLTNIQKHYENIDIYENREVVVLKNGEKWGPTYMVGNAKFYTPINLIGKAVFFGEEDLADLKTSMGPGAENRLDVIGTESKTPSYDELRQVKERFLAAIINTTPPTTFILTGHGSPQGTYYHDGQIVGEKPKAGEEMQFIKHTEMAAAIQRRLEKFGPEAVGQDIFVNDSCYSHTYFRNLETVLSEGKIRMPILISSTEYGQYGISSFNRKASFLVKAMGMGQRKIKIKYVIDHEKDYKDSNTTIYATDPKRGTPAQITKNKENNPSKTA